MVGIRARERIAQLKFWFEERDTRERVLVFLLSWALIYAIFDYGFFNALDTEQEISQANINQKTQDIHNGNLELANLEAMKKTPLYQQWIKNQSFKTQMRSQIGSSGPGSTEKQWQQVYSVVLQPHPGISLLQVKKMAENPFKTIVKTTEETNIYAQPLLVVIEGRYFDFVNYVAYLEKQLPFVKWNKIHYTVKEYPLARIEMEFSILYEKS